MTAVMRTPTRTKTKSLGGRQNDFKFPSIEALPRFVLHEEDLNNHYIVNEVFSKSPVLKARDDNESQLVSEYTSVSNTNTNTNSSNGYYSFANISDNTTTSRMNGTFSEAVLHGSLQLLQGLIRVQIIQRLTIRSILLFLPPLLQN